MHDQNHVISSLFCILSYNALTRSDAEALNTSRYSYCKELIKQHDTKENNPKFENSWDTFTQDDIVIQDLTTTGSQLSPFAPSNGECGF